MTQVLKKRSCQDDTVGMDLNRRHIVTMQVRSLVFSPVLWVGSNRELELRSKMLFVRLILSLTLKDLIVPIRVKSSACSLILSKIGSHVVTANQESL